MHAPPLDDSRVRRVRLAVVGRHLDLIQDVGLLAAQPQVQRFAGGFLACSGAVVVNGQGGVPGIELEPFLGVPGISP